MKRYIIVEWPSIQYLISCKDFNEHVCLIDDDSWIDQYGSPTYFVEEEWLCQNHKFEH